MPFINFSWYKRNTLFKVYGTERSFTRICAEAYSEPSRTSNMELFAKIINSWKPWTISQKAPSYMFDWVLNKPLVYAQKFYQYTVLFILNKFRETWFLLEKRYASTGLWETKFNISFKLKFIFSSHFSSFLFFIF